MIKTLDNKTADMRKRVEPKPNTLERLCLCLSMRQHGLLGLVEDLVLDRRQTHILDNILCLTAPLLHREILHMYLFYLSTVASISPRHNTSQANFTLAQRAGGLSQPYQRIT